MSKTSATLEELAAAARRIRRYALRMGEVQGQGYIGQALGWADVIWHDIRGRLLLPRIKPKLRHKVCVMTYSLLGASWVIKAFGHAASTDIPGALPLAIYALSMSTACGMVALALALERR